MFMATFLFLVSITATTLLLLAIAADEVLDTTRRLFGRLFASAESPHGASSKYYERSTESNEDAARALKAKLAQGTAQGLAKDKTGDWVPDRAA